MFAESDRELQEATGQLRSVDRQSPDAVELCRHVLELCGIAIVRGRKIESELEQVADFTASCVDVYAGDVARFRNHVSRWESSFSLDSDLGKERDDASQDQVAPASIRGWQAEADEFEALDACADIVFGRARLELTKIGVTQLLAASNCEQEQESVVNQATQLLGELDTVLTNELNQRRLCRIVGLPLIRNLRQVMNWSEEGTDLRWWVDRTLERVSQLEEEWVRNLRRLLHTLRHDLVALPLIRDQPGHFNCPAMEDVKIAVTGDEMLLEGDRFSYIVLGVGAVGHADRTPRKLQWTVNLPQKPLLAQQSQSSSRNRQIVKMAAASGAVADESGPQHNWTLSVTTDWVNLLHEFDHETSILHLAAEAPYQVGFDWEVRHNRGRQQGQAWSSRTSATDSPYRAVFSADFPEGAEQLTISLSEFVDPEVFPSHRVSNANFASVWDDGGTRLPITLTAQFDPGCDNPFFRHLQDPKRQLTLLCLSRTDVDSRLLDDQYSRFAADLEVRHSASVFSLLRAKGATREEAEDVLQTALMECMRRVRESGVENARSTMPSDKAERAYLTDLAMKRFIDVVRRNARWSKYLSDQWDDRVDVESISDIETELATESLDDLPVSEDDRMLLHFHFVDGYALNEIADIRNVEANAIRQRMSRLKRKIGELLIENAPPGLSVSCCEILKKAFRQSNTEEELADWMRGLDLGDAEREKKAPQDYLQWAQLDEAQKAEWIVRSQRTLGRAIKTLLSLRSNRK